MVWAWRISDCQRRKQETSQWHRILLITTHMLTNTNQFFALSNTQQIVVTPPFSQHPHKKIPFALDLYLSISTLVWLPAERQLDPCVAQGDEGETPDLQKRQARKTILSKSNFLWLFNQVLLDLPHLMQRQLSIYTGHDFYLIKGKGL